MRIGMDGPIVLVSKGTGLFPRITLISQEMGGDKQQG